MIGPIVAVAVVLAGCVPAAHRPAPSANQVASALTGQREIAYDGGERPGTVIVDPGDHRLYLVERGGRALSWPVAVGRAGYAFSGRAVVGRKAEWPRWTPTAGMIRKDPVHDAPLAAGGLPGGPANPLGARALYLYQHGRDTLYRIHGTNDPGSIGKSVSSGCIRMFNRDVISLYDRVPSGAPVIVLPKGQPVPPKRTGREQKLPDRL